MNYELVALWSQVVAAVLFVAILIWGFLKLIVPAIETATAAKNDEIHALERRRDDSLKAVVLARAEVVEAEQDAKSILERSEHDARREADMLIAEAQAEAERIVRNANGELDRERQAARDRLRIRLIEKALNMARRSAAEQIDAGTNESLVSRFIDELEREGRG